MDKQSKEVSCCPVFDPARWNEQKFTWENKMFIRGSTFQVLHYPLPGMIRRIMKKLWKQATEVKAEPIPEDFLMLTYDLSPWKCEFYMPVRHSVPGADNVKLSGTYFTKVFDGPFSMVPQYINEMDILLTQKDLFAKRYFIYSAACPLCERKYMVNSIVAFAEI
jgi:hypothetical protein